MPDTPKPPAMPGEVPEIANLLDKVEQQLIDEGLIKPREDESLQPNEDDEVFIDDGWEEDPRVWRATQYRENLLRILTVIEREGVLADRAVRYKAGVWGTPKSAALRELLNGQAITEKVGLPGEPRCRHYVLGPAASEFRKRIERSQRSP